LRAHGRSKNGVASLAWRDRAKARPDVRSSLAIDIQAALTEKRCCGPAQDCGCKALERAIVCEFSQLADRLCLRRALPQLPSPVFK
jgi:hypothetical protein